MRPFLHLLEVALLGVGMILKRRLVFTGERRGEQHPGGSEGRGTSEKLSCGLDAVGLGLVPGEPPPWERPSFLAVLLGGAESGLCVRIAVVLGCGLSQSIKCSA